MKETIIMNIKTQISYVLALYLMCISLTACTEETLPETETPPTGLCFQIQKTDTRITYNETASLFDQGDVIGCVIATRNGSEYQFLSNSKWHYTSGVLVLDDDGYNSNIIQRTTEDSEDGFLTITGNDTYYFFFYYPYVTLDLVRTDINNAITKYNEDNSKTFYQYLTFPHWATNEGLNANIGYDITLPTNDPTNWVIQSYALYFTLCGTAAATTNTNNAIEHNWTVFPCFVNHYQGSKTAANYSDFLWCSYVMGVNSTSDDAINLEFQKKTATIEVMSDIELTDIYFRSPEENSLLRGNKINLQTGELSNYIFNVNGSIQERQMYMGTTDIIRPLRMNTPSSTCNYRLMLPAQRGFRCNMYFSLQNDTETLHTIALDDNINELKTGGRYIIHINRRGESTLEIVDWEDDHFEILTPNN